MTLHRVALVVLSTLLAASPLCEAVAQGKPLVTAADLGKWESLGVARLSPDGRWLAYGITRGNQESELRLRDAGSDSTTVVPYGLSPQFSADRRWFAYLQGVSVAERERLTKDKKPVHNSFGLRDLQSGAVITINDVSAFEFNPSGGFVAVTRYPADGKKTHELLVLDLTTGARLSFTNVGEHGWSDIKPLLAFSVTVDGATGNGLHLFDGTTGAVRVLENTPNIYRGIAWKPNGADLAVLRSAVDKAFVDTAHVVLRFSAPGDGVSAPTVLEPESARGFPKDTRIADYRTPTWSQDGRTLYVGVRRREPVAEAIRKRDEKVSDVEIWHTNDVRVIPEQRSSEQRDARATMIAAWRPADSIVVPVGTDPYASTTVLEHDQYAIQLDREPYAWGQKFGRPDQDVWAVEVQTGARRKLLSTVRYLFATDPSGRRVAWFDGKDYWAIEVASGARTNLTARLRSVDFVDRDDDHPLDVPSPIGSPTWTRDGNAVLLNSAYDVWLVSLDGAGGRRLTDGAASGVVHRVMSFAGFGGSVVDRAVDLSGPVYFSLVGKRTKQSGYARLMPGGAVERLLLADASITGLTKADSADRYTFVRQTYTESPNVFVADGTLKAPTRLTATNAFQSEYAWGKAELMNFTSTIGRPLQAILYYPANYDPSKKYPMIVYTYEMLSQGLHRYVAPRENDYYNATVFTQNGYFVLMPDIVFRPREPGVAVLHSVEPAVRAVIRRGLVDPANIGHCGHSQGGYEAFYLATHSSLFKTAVAGAGISDMVSFAGQMHWSSVPEFSHWETGQFRMQVPPWEDMDAMMRNSPLNKVHVMPAASILIEIGGEDPTVDMRQGVLFWNYARRAGKDAVMLLYPGEGHGLGKRENAIDYERRILQWFAYYLKGEKPEAWITNGQSWLERKAMLDANRDR